MKTASQDSINSATTTTTATAAITTTAADQTEVMLLCFQGPCFAPCSSPYSPPSPQDENWNKKSLCFIGFQTREGTIIEWPLNGQLHNAITDDLTSRTSVSGVLENVRNVVNVI